MTLVSVVIPAKNRPSMLREAVDSVISQTYRNIEIIIVLTGATEAVRNTANDLAASHGVRLLETRALNLAATRNAGLAIAKGEWISFLDDDDIWELAKLARQLALAKATDAGLVTTNWRRFNADGSIENWRPLGGTPWGKLTPQEALMLGNCVSVGCLVRTDIIRACGGFDPSFSACEDWDAWRRISQVCDVAYLDDYLLRVRIHGGNMSRNHLFMLRWTLRHFRKMLGDTPHHLRPMLWRLPDRIVFALLLAIHQVANAWSGGRTRRAWLWLKSRSYPV